MTQKEFDKLMNTPKKVKGKTFSSEVAEKMAKFDLIAFSRKYPIDAYDYVDND